MLGGREQQHERQLAHTVLQVTSVAASPKEQRSSHSSRSSQDRHRKQAYGVSLRSTRGLGRRTSRARAKRLDIARQLVSPAGMRNPALRLKVSASHNVDSASWSTKGHPSARVRTESISLHWISRPPGQCCWRGCDSIEADQQYITFTSHHAHEAGFHHRVQKLGTHGRDARKSKDLPDSQHSFASLASMSVCTKQAVSSRGLSSSDQDILDVERTLTLPL